MAWPMLAMCWKDKKAVSIVSTAHSIPFGPQPQVSRHTSQGQKVQVTCPKVVMDYQRWFHGVDTADQLRSSYSVKRAGKKWWIQP